MLKAKSSYSFSKAKPLRDLSLLRKLREQEYDIRMDLLEM
jgi:hypothetical protein